MNMNINNEENGRISPDSDESVEKVEATEKAEGIEELEKSEAAPASDDAEVTAAPSGTTQSEYAFHWHYEEESPKKSKAKKKNGTRRYAIVMTSAFAVCFLMLLAVLFIDGFANITKVVRLERTVFIRDAENEGDVLTVAEIAEKMSDSFVALEVTKPSKKSIGSGIIISEDGYIATNSHLVSDATQIRVIMQDGTEFSADLVGRNEESDIAVLKADRTGLVPATLGDSDELIVGEHVTAIGTPASLDLIGTVTDGIISGVNREVKFYDDETGALEKTMYMIQTNASINSGNSGGPLVNDSGEVIGIVTMKLTDGYDGVGFAIPINGAKQVIDSIIENGGDTSDGSEGIVKKRALIGIQGKAVSPLEGFSISGVLVASVEEDADAANYLEPGDIIIGINGNEVLSVDDISDTLEQLSPGDSVTLVVSRGGKHFECDIILASE